MCRSMKIKHLGVLVLLVSVFLYGVVQTLYLLSPALERLSHHIYPEETHNHVLEGPTRAHTTQGHHRLGEGRTGGSHIGATKGREGHILRYRVIVNKNLGGGPARARGKGGLVKEASHRRDVGVASLQQEDRDDTRSRNQSSETAERRPYHEQLKNKKKGHASDGDSADYCPQVRRPRRVTDSRTWHTVVPGSVHVFSAFYESRLWQPAIRVVALMAQGYRGNLTYCQVWTDGAPHPEVVSLEANMVPEGHLDKKFAVYLLMCRLRTDRRPAAVSLVEARCQSPTALLPVLNADSSRERRVDFTVCLTPVHFAYNDTKRLVETIELNRMFGAQRFLFYNYSIGSDVDRYIRSYVKDGLAEVIPWRIPVGVDMWPRAGKPEVHYFGQLAALNDCLYRNMYKSRYIVFSDLDEIIVPKAQNTWKELLSRLQRDYRQKRFSKFGAFLFQCVFFRTDWPDDVNVTSLPAARKYNLLSLLKTSRERDVYPWGMRSKYIVDPLKVAMVGIHNAWRFIANRYMENNVPAELGLLHHYRYWAEPALQPPVIDNSLHKYTDVILSRVRERHDIVPLPRSKGKR